MLLVGVGEAERERVEDDVLVTELVPDVVEDCDVVPVGLLLAVRVRVEEGVMLLVSVGEAERERVEDDVLVSEPVAV